MNFSLEVYQIGALALTTTIDRSRISDNVNANDFYKRKLNPKFNENIEIRINCANQVEFHLQFQFVEFWS